MFYLFTWITLAPCCRENDKTRVPDTQISLPHVFSFTFPHNQHPISLSPSHFPSLSLLIDPVHVSLSPSISVVLIHSSIDPRDAPVSPPHHNRPLLWQKSFLLAKFYITVILSLWYYHMIVYAAVPPPNYHHSFTNLHIFWNRHICCRY